MYIVQHTEYIQRGRYQNDVARAKSERRSGQVQLTRHDFFLGEKKRSQFQIGEAGSAASNALGRCVETRHTHRRQLDGDARRKFMAVHVDHGRHHQAG